MESSSLIKWLEKGLKQGIEQGIDIGAEKGAYATKLFLTTSKSDEEIAKDTGLSVNKIREFREKFGKMP